MTDPTPPDAEPALSADELAAAEDGALLAPLPCTILDLRGPGAVDCLQGLLTNDVAAPGTDGVVYGALLTPKGMIVTDLWALRDGDGFRLLVPPAGAAAAAEIFRRTLPPRLARTADLTATHGGLLLLGSGAERALGRAGLDPIPAPEHLAAHDGCLLARPRPEAPFRFIITGPAEDLASFGSRLRAGGAGTASDAQVTVARLLAGWPALGQEIDEKTLPQEVRFDEIGGVSYTKGCYTGQETVARVHFRGHPNRELRALVWDGAPDLGDRSIQHLGREVGTIRTTIVVEGQRIGLAPIRREVQENEIVSAGGAPARVLPAPRIRSALLL